MIGVTPDTNTLASGTLARSGAIAELIEAWRDDTVRFVISDRILAELERPLRQPSFAERLHNSDRRQFLLALLEFALIVEIAEPVPTVLPHYADNLVLATALTGNARFLISGNRELQRRESYQGVRIVTARALLNTAFC